VKKKIQPKALLKFQCSRFHEVFTC
jgi:hypothetical protein